MNLLKKRLQLIITINIWLYVKNSKSNTVFSNINKKIKVKSKK